MNKIEKSGPNFERLVLGCIDAKFCKRIFVGKIWKALDDICKIYILLHRSDPKISAKTSPLVDETQLQVVFTLDEVGTVYCKPVRKLFATPTLNEILAYGESLCFLGQRERELGEN